MKNQISGMKGFLILWSGQSVSALGSSMTSYALILWVYGQQGTATSITLLTFFTFLPSILFSFAAGTLADKWDKKKTMLLSDTIAAFGTMTVLILHGIGSLQIWHLYIINFLISLMTAFQKPATYVVTSMLVPKEYYSRASGMQSFSDSVLRLLTPALAIAMLAFGGLQTIFIIDIITFAIAFLTLLVFVEVPLAPSIKDEKETFLRRCMQGIGFLWEHKPLFKLILYMALINFLAYLSGYGILPAMVLSRSGGNQTILGMVSSAMGVGSLVGSISVTFLKPAKKKTRLIFIALGISFLLGDVLWGFGRNAAMWVFSGFSGNLLVPFVNASMFTIMRTNIPPELQGRAFSARDTIQFFTIPLALFLGGYLADNVFEPFMQTAIPLQRIASLFVGTGKGSGMAVIFLLTGVTGVLSSLLSLRSTSFGNLDSDS